MFRKLKRAVRLNCPYGTPHTDLRKLTFDKEMLKKLKRTVRLTKLTKDVHMVPPQGPEKANF